MRHIFTCHRHIFLHHVIVLERFRSRVNDFLHQRSQEGIRHAVTQHNEQPRSQYVLVIVLNKSLRQLVHLRSYLVTFFLDFLMHRLQILSIHNHATFLALYLVSTVVERVFLYHKIIETIVQWSPLDGNSRIVYLNINVTRFYH